MEDFLPVAFRLATAIFGNVVNRARLLGCLSFIFFSLAIFGGSISDAKLEIFYSFCLGQAVFLMVRAVALTILSFLAAIPLAFAGDDSPLSWNVYFEKAMLATDVSVVLYLTFKNPVAGSMTGVVAWALTANYVSNVVARIMSRMSVAAADGAIAFDCASIISMPISIVLGVVLIVFALYRPVDIFWLAQGHSREALTYYPLVFASAGCFYFLQLGSSLWIESKRAAPPQTKPIAENQSDLAS